MRSFFSLFVIALAATGCGRQASEADCMLIVDRNVEVQAKAGNITDPVEIKKRQDKAHAEAAGLVKDCVGRRITDRQLACVATAQTKDEISKCFK